MPSRRMFLAQSAAVFSTMNAGWLWSQPVTRDFNVLRYGAIGDGIVDDTAAIQKAIDAASITGSGARVLLPGDKRFLSGTLQLRSRIDFHLADDAVLLAHTDPAKYAGSGSGLLMADASEGLKISGTGYMDGQAMKFVTTYSDSDQRWEPKAFRPRMFSLRACKGLRGSRPYVRTLAELGTSSARL